MLLLSMCISMLTIWFLKSMRAQAGLQLGEFCRSPLHPEQFSKPELKKLAEDDRLNKSLSAGSLSHVTDETRQSLKLMRQRHDVIYANQLKRVFSVICSLLKLLVIYRKSN